MAHPHSTQTRRARRPRRVAPAALLVFVLVPALGAAEPEGPALPRPLSNSPLDIGPPAPAEPPAGPETPPTVAEAPASAAAPISPRETQPLGPGAARSKAASRDSLHPRNSGGAPGGESTPGKLAAGGTGWMTRTGVALALVLGLIFSIKWATQRLARRAGGLAWQLGPAGRAPSGVLEVLGRFPVSRGHSLILLKMDRRVLLLGQSSAGFTTLSQVTEPEEVASLIIKTRDEEGASLAARFNEILHGMERDPSLTGDDAPEISPGAPATGPRLPRIGLSTVNA